MKAILFDAGNTLVWLDHPFLVALLAEHGVAVDAEALLVAEYAAKRVLDERLRAGEVDDDRARGRIYFAEVFRQIEVPAGVLAPLAERLWARHRERNLWSNVRPGTDGALAELRRRGYRLGVVSNADGRVEALLGEVGLLPHFDCVVDSGVEGVEKPDPRIFRIACERMGVDPAESAYVGDIYEIDVVGARGVGMRPFLVDPLARWDDLPCERIRDLPDLLGHFAGAS
jgi:HAD superfamily hydrolase (TIGR01662 family)